MSNTPSGSKTAREAILPLTLIVVLIGAFLISLFAEREIAFEYIGTVSTYERFRRIDGTYSGSDTPAAAVWMFHEAPSQLGDWRIQLYQSSLQEEPINFEEYSYISVTGYMLEHVYISRWRHDTRLDRYIPRIVLNDACQPNTINYFRISKNEHIHLAPDPEDPGNAAPVRYHLGQ